MEDIDERSGWIKTQNKNIKSKLKNIKNRSFLMRKKKKDKLTLLKTFYIFKEPKNAKTYVIDTGGILLNIQKVRDNRYIETCKQQ